MTRLLRHVLMPVALSMSAAGCLPTMTQTYETDTMTKNEICGIVSIIRYSRNDTTETQRQVVMNNAALRSAGCGG